jgi:3-oxoacyl-[acyl-carrier-protein] synthase II
MGVVSPIGSTLQNFWESLQAGRCGIARIEGFDPTDFSAQIAGEAKDFDANDFIPRKEQRRMDRFCHFAIAAARMAMDEADFDREVEDPTRMGAIVGSGIGGLKTLEEQHSKLLAKGPSRCSPFMIPQMITNMASGHVAIEHKLQGPNYAVVSACATAAHAIGAALHAIQRNEADVMLAGGAEAAITALGIGGFAAMKALSTRNDDPQTASRPFDKERDGFVMGEGAAVLVLEEYEHAKSRGAKIYAELTGYATTCDGNHLTTPSREGMGNVMNLVLQNANLTPQDIGYINAHATSTQKGDIEESHATHEIFGKNVPISSTKSYMGHLLGGCGVVESIISIMALNESFLPANKNLDNVDPACADLDYIKEHRECTIENVMSNNFAFGGINTSLIFSKLT